MSSLEEAIYAAALIDAFRNIFQDLPIDRRMIESKREALMVVEAFRDSQKERP